MPLLTSYAFQETFFHRLDPRTKLVWLVAMMAISFTTNKIPLLAGLIIVVLALSWLAKLDLKSFLPLTKVVSYIAICILLIQTIFQTEGETFFQLGSVGFHVQGLWLGVQVMLRLYCVALLFLQFLMWTHPTDLSLILLKAGLPYRYAMLLGLALRFFPVLEEELGNIFEAQEARGVELQGAVRRAFALVPIVLPFCLRALRRTNEVALAMELRGYGFRLQRTFLRSIGYRPTDYAITAALLILLVAYFVASMYLPINS